MGEIMDRLLLKTLSKLEPNQTTDLYCYRELNSKIDNLKNIICELSKEHFIEIDTYSGEIVIRLTSRGFEYIRDSLKEEESDRLMLAEL